MRRANPRVAQRTSGLLKPTGMVIDRVAGGALETAETGVTHFRRRPGKRSPFVHRHDQAGPEGLEFLAFGPHYDSDGAPVEDPWVA